MHFQMILNECKDCPRELLSIQEVKSSVTLNHLDMSAKRVPQVIECHFLNFFTATEVKSMQDLAMREDRAVMSVFSLGATLIAQKIVKKNTALMFHNLDGGSTRMAHIIHDKAGMDDLPVIQAMNGHLKIRRTEDSSNLIHCLFQGDLRNVTTKPFDFAGGWIAHPGQLRFRKG